MGDTGDGDFCGVSRSGHGRNAFETVDESFDFVVDSNGSVQCVVVVFSVDYWFRRGLASRSNFWVAVWVVFRTVGDSYGEGGPLAERGGISEFAVGSGAVIGGVVCCLRSTGSKEQAGAGIVGNVFRCASWVVVWDRVLAVYDMLVVALNGRGTGNAVVG